VIVHGNGYYLTKHAVGVYSAEPPDSAPEPPGSRHHATTTIPIEADASGPARIAAWTVPYGRDGSPEQGIVICDTDRGTRTLARADSELTETLAGSDRDVVGETVLIRHEPDTNVATSGT
jgi:acetyl-CoA C-acetyltransferase